MNARTTQDGNAGRAATVSHHDAKPNAAASAPSHARYQQIIQAALTPLLPSGAPLALVDFPCYDNPGDAAIWWGTLLCLEDRMQRRIIARHDQTSMLGRPARFPSGTIILIHGGGNFGDLWPHHQQLRTEILTRYRDHRVVQLPQSIHYQSPKNLERDRLAFNAHPDFHLICRDAESMAICQANFEASVYLTPDMAHFLDGRIRRHPARRPAVGFFRSDLEGLGFADAAARAGLPLRPWMSRHSGLPFTLETLARIPATKAPVKLNTANLLRQALFDRIARRRVETACKNLSEAERFASDRLHCHILGDVLGIEHVMLDNSYRKIGRYMESWPAVTGSSYHGDSLAAALTEIGFGAGV